MPRSAKAHASKASRLGAREGTPRPTDPHPPSRGLPLGGERFVALAKELSDATGALVVGGVAVMLYGYTRMTDDIDLYDIDPAALLNRLDKTGLKWDRRLRRHTIEGVPIHVVGADVLGLKPSRPQRRRGVRVISLPDLIHSKLRMGMRDFGGMRHLCDVVELVKAVPLRRPFTPRLPRDLRPKFGQVVNQVHNPRAKRIPTLEFWGWA